MKFIFYKFKNATFKWLEWLFNIWNLGRHRFFACLCFTRKNAKLAVPVLPPSTPPRHTHTVLCTSMASLNHPMMCHKHMQSSCLTKQYSFHNSIGMKHCQRSLFQDISIVLFKYEWCPWCHQKALMELQSHSCDCWKNSLIKPMSFRVNSSVSIVWKPCLQLLWIGSLWGCVTSRKNKTKHNQRERDRVRIR